jgi:hypothetical protein
MDLLDASALVSYTTYCLKIKTKRNLKKKTFRIFNIREKEWNIFT